MLAGPYFWLHFFGRPKNVLKGLLWPLHRLASGINQPCRPLDAKTTNMHFHTQFAGSETLGFLSILEGVGATLRTASGRPLDAKAANMQFHSQFAGQTSPQAQKPEGFQAF